MRTLKIVSGPDGRGLLFEALPFKIAVCELNLPQELVRKGDHHVIFKTDEGEQVSGFAWYIGVNYCSGASTLALILGPQEPTLFRGPSSDRRWYIGNYDLKESTGEFTEISFEEIESNPILCAILFSGAV